MIKKEKRGNEMNDYIQMQIRNMVSMTKTFEQACELAAMKNDGKIDAAEIKTLKKIKAASDKFIKEIESIK